MKGTRSFTRKRKEQHEHVLCTKTIVYTKTEIKDTKKKKKEDYLLLKNKIIAS
jgi:hypothetical protein